MINRPQSLRKSLECLRLATSCRDLADGVTDAQLRAHFIRMARGWNGLACSGLAEAELATLVPANDLAA